MKDRTIKAVITVLIVIGCLCFTCSCFDDDDLFSDYQESDYGYEDVFYGASGYDWAIEDSIDTSNLMTMLDTFEDRYGIRVDLDGITNQSFNNSDTAYSFYESADDMRYEMMLSLCTGFSRIPDELVELGLQVADFSVYLAVASDSGDEDVDGEYIPDENSMYLYCNFNPSTAVHEFNHMLTYLLMSLYGSEQALCDRWMPLNEGIPYSCDYSSLSEDEQLHFYTDYASTDVYEDIAETAILLADGSTPQSVTLKKKVELLHELYSELLAANPEKLGIFGWMYDTGGVTDEYWDDYAA